jgi:TPR repeat protein
MYRDGYGVGLDKSEAARYFGQSCNKGNAFGCANLADLLFAGDGVAKDEKRALDLFRQACEGGHAVSCRNVESIEKGAS